MLSRLRLVSYDKVVSLQLLVYNVHCTRGVLLMLSLSKSNIPVVSRSLHVSTLMNSLVIQITC